MKIFICPMLFAAFLVLGGSSSTFAESKLPPINLPGEIGGRLAQCWQAPRTDPPRTFEVTVRLSFSRAGAVIGEPRVVYILPAADSAFKEKVTASLLAAIKACTPLPFTPSLGAAIAGRMFAIRLRSLPLSGRQRLT